MAETKAKKGLISHGIVSQNRKARYDYTIKDTIEAGLVLKGAEVKSLRNGRATLTEAWAGEREGVTLVPLQIHFNDRGRAKVLLGIGEGRKKADKRAAVATRDWQRDRARLLRARG